MRKLPLLLLLMFASTCGTLRAQSAAATDISAGVPLVDRAHAGDWVTDIVDGWRTHEGDDPAWASAGFDDSGWKTVEIDDMGAARPGWRWYRLHIKLHENHPGLSLLMDGGEGTYALYVNGEAVAGPAIRSQFAVKRPTERIVPLNAPGTDVELALRTYTPSCYSTWHLPSFLTVALGTPDAVEYERQSLQSERLYAVFPVIAINLLIMLAGIGAFALHRSQPTHLEYLWLGIYLFLSGLSAMLWGCQTNGLLPLSANFLAGDPLVYAFTIAQIEFTYSFGGRRVGRLWRVYEVLLLAPMLLIWLTWQGHMSSAFYLLIEALIVIPVALLLPVLLLLWYRRGNREAGWLILPSLLPAALVTLNGFGSVSIYLGWHRLDFLDNSIPVGAAQLSLPDVGDLLFLLAIVVVMFFRFTRVSREQARATAELDAAREIQQRLVPASLPALAGYRIEAAYLPAAEVGGDFYQVLTQADSSALIVVGDVSGKGLKAAMTGALAIGALRTLAAENLGPGALLGRLNHQICATQDSGFITCICARVDAEGTVTVANAGHLSPYCSGEEIPVDPGLPLGIDAGVEYAETQFPLAPGAVLTLLSDGVVEAQDAQGQLYGFERTRLISKESASNIAAAAQGFGQEDDITVLTIARVAEPVPA
jgi:serine phosphatase RsbU (regulator of sigma subunit)